MTEEERKPDTLEQRFRELEEKLIDKIRVVYKEELVQFPAGVAVKIASGKEMDSGLYLDSNGNWDARLFTSGWGIGTKPTLLGLLDNYVTVTEKSYCSIDLELQHKYLQMNKEVLVEGLVSRMQQVLDRLR
jgi:benzoyl-CoA reductase/2-hydroxyglutaryl-CoA dehydratase subunit BcrC/BadD/HgdB